MMNGSEGMPFLRHSVQTFATLRFPSVLGGNWRGDGAIWSREESKCADGRVNVYFGRTTEAVYCDLKVE